MFHGTQNPSQVLFKLYSLPKTFMLPISVGAASQ